jgi:glycosyltransferase involved in cell wall biosynthesis
MKPRLVFINRYYRPDESATSQILTDLAESLAASGAEVHIVCSRQLYEDATAQLPATQLISGVQVKRIWTTRFGRRSLPGRALDYASFYLSVALTLARMLRPGDIVVAKTDPPMVSVVVSWAARLRGAVLVNWLQDVFPEVLARLEPEMLPGWIYRLLLGVRNTSLRRARMNIVLGERMAQHIRQYVDASRIVVTANWADGALITPRSIRDSELRRRLGLEGSFVVGYSGNLGRAHEFATVLDAARRLQWESNIVFLFVGGGARFDQLRREVEQSVLQNFRFLPYQPRAGLADSLAAADVHLACLLPALEGLIVPSKAYGILAAGRPLIAIGDPTGELATLVNTHSCGMAVECDDGAALAAEILRLEGDRAACERMGKAARIAFEQHYSLESASLRWHRLLGTVHESMHRTSQVVRET